MVAAGSAPRFEFKEGLLVQAHRSGNPSLLDSRCCRMTCHARTCTSFLWLTEWFSVTRPYMNNTSERIMKVCPEEQSLEIK